MEPYPILFLSPASFFFSLTLSLPHLFPKAGGSLGVSVEGGVEASSVSSMTGRDLSLEAIGGKLNVVGGEGGLSVEGGFPGGNKGVEILSNADMTLTSELGSVSVD